LHWLDSPMCQNWRWGGEKANLLLSLDHVYSFNQGILPPLSVYCILAL
jgi:hypothetical protein